MQLILVRHAQPERVVGDTTAADPGLTGIGGQQAERVPAALAAHDIARIVSSPQRRARETAAPTAAARGLPVEVFDDLAEYDRDLPAYIPIEDAKTDFAEAYARIKAGFLPEQIDGAAFTARVLTAIDGLVAAAAPTDTVVAFAHGGVVNVLLADILGLTRPLTFPIDYCSVTRILYSRTGSRTAATINENGHVWDLLPRNMSRATP
ncbi:histidine phosphatase family protein [Nocardia asteroides]|uniref:histidine phosphatase family protein n=1 Tax=Nocardia asteroides TaxID=1824 RepID=UPI0004C12F58|nr:histidine phosphatase family protein [Nocardia asteroides]TLF69016.1 histidine phosphatase family protein [Nocardia asteroides NBRC 15531]UGT48488.1 histidine phosphatase family protein [Nocardia asteroides]